MSAPARNSAGSPSRGRTTRRRSRSRLLTRASGSVGPVEPDHALPVEILGSFAGPAADSAGRLAPPRRSARSAPVPAAGLEGRLGDVGARPDQLVVAREEALQELPCRLVAGHALVDPAEEDLHQHPGHLRREDALDRLVEGRHVERLRVPQRRRPGARGRMAHGRGAGRPGHGASRRSSAPLMSSGSARRRAAGRSAAGCSGRSPAPAGSLRYAAPRVCPASRISVRLSRIAVRESDGATIRTRWPRCGELL